MLLQAASSVQTASAPEWVSIVAAFGLGALLASIVQGGVLWLNGRAQRRHETALRTADRQHETELRRIDHEHERAVDLLADRRAQRDHREARIYGNLHMIVEAAVLVMDQVQRLRLYPQEYKDASVDTAKAIEQLQAVRAAIRLDEETDVLMDRLSKAVRDFHVWWIALETREQAREAKEGRLGDLTMEAIRLGDALAELLREIIREAREALAKAEAALE